MQAICGLWPREGGRATRLTVGVGIESAPMFLPMAATIAFTGEYDGNTDVFTIPTTGGVPYRRDVSSGSGFCGGLDTDGKQIVFRSNRESASRYTQLYKVPAKGGVARVLPLPMAYQGEIRRMADILRIRRFRRRSGSITHRCVVGQLSRRAL